MQETQYNGRFNGEYEVIFKGKREMMQQLPPSMLQIAQADIERQNQRPNGNAPSKGEDPGNVIKNLGGDASTNRGDPLGEKTTKKVECPANGGNSLNSSHSERKGRFQSTVPLQLDHFPELYYLAAHVETALEEQQGKEAIVCRVHLSDHDYGGFYTSCLKQLKTQMPDLAMAVLVQYEYEEGYIIHRGYSPAGSQHPPIDRSRQTREVLPEEDWIPFGWRHPGTAPRYQAQGTIGYLGDWGEAERTQLQQRIRSGEWLKACGFRPKETDQPAIVATDSGFSFALIGDVNLSNSLQVLQGLFDLSGYTQAHQAEYTALCRTMYEKKLLIHVEFHDYSNADWYGNYESSSHYHYLISSDGAHLVPTFTRCSTYGWGASFIDYSSPLQYLVPSLYKLSMENVVEHLPQHTQTLVCWNLFRFLAEHPIPPLSNADPEKRDAADWSDCPEKFSFHRAEHVMSQVEHALQGYFLEHKAALLACIQRAKDKAEECDQIPVRFHPETFDHRFAGKRFYIDGDLVSYSRAQLEQEIEGFDGVLVGNAAKADYFIYGSGIGNTFLKGLENGVTFLSENYFEAMTRESGS